MIIEPETDRDWTLQVSTAFLSIHFFHTLIEFAAIELIELIRKDSCSFSKIF